MCGNECVCLWPADEIPVCRGGSGNLFWHVAHFSPVSAYQHRAGHIQITDKKKGTHSTHCTHKCMHVFMHRHAGSGTSPVHSLNFLSSYLLKQYGESWDTIYLCKQQQCTQGETLLHFFIFLLVCKAATLAWLPTKTLCFNKLRNANIS